MKGHMPRGKKNNGAKAKLEAQNKIKSKREKEAETKKMVEDAVRRETVTGASLGETYHKAIEQRERESSEKEADLREKKAEDKLD